MKILFIGDIVAEPGRKTIKQVLPDLRKELGVDLVVANAENAAAGRGITPGVLEELQSYGVDYFTSGDHVFWQRGTEDVIDDLPIIRPANYPEGTPGNGHFVLDLGAKGKVLLVNLMGRTSFGNVTSYTRDPFEMIDAILESYKDEKFAASIIDFHAEATSEKSAFGFYVDGKVTAVIGTHTHVPTCDHRVLPKGTMFVSDAGMTGIIDSVLGVKTDIVINLFKSARNQRFEWESAGTKAFRSVLLDTVEGSIERVDKVL
jgi:2',3'-cyclic-nucleotide 2'-phosphodiesterase